MGEEEGIEIEEEMEDENGEEGWAEVEEAESEGSEKGAEAEQSELAVSHKCRLHARPAPPPRPPPRPPRRAATTPACCHAVHLVLARSAPA